MGAFAAPVFFTLPLLRGNEMATKQPRAIKVRDRVNYNSRANSGTATVKRIYDGKTGKWVELFDGARKATVTVRLSQVQAL